MLQPSANAAVTHSRPEAELLLCCARTSVDSERAGRIRALLQADIDWPSFIRTAHVHGVIPLVYRSLRTTCPEAVPKTILDKLQDRFQANARRNILLTKELLSLLHRFEINGIPAMPLKGPILAVSAYGDLALRQFGDLDILVHHQEFLRAKDVLISLSYRPGFPKTHEQQVTYMQSAHAYPFLDASNRINVDIHARVTQRYFPLPLDPQDLWERSEPIVLLNSTVRNLSPEDVLLILCAHGAKHAWGRLKWICDVAELLRTHPRMNWGQAMEQASRLGGARMLVLGLRLAHELLGAALPDDMSERIRADRVGTSLAAQVHDHLLSEGGIPLTIVDWPAFHLIVRERVSDRVPYCLYYLPRFVRRVVRPSATDRALLPLPALLFPLYYLLRPIRVTAKYSLKAFRHLYTGRSPR